MRQYRNYSLIPSEKQTINGRETTLSEVKWRSGWRKRGQRGVKEGMKRGNECRTLQKLDTTLVRLSSKVTSSDEIGPDTRDILI